MRNEEGGEEKKKKRKRREQEGDAGYFLASITFTSLLIWRIIV